MVQRNLAVYQPSESAELSTSLSGIVSKLRQVAEQSVDAAISAAEGDAYTGLERRAMIAGEALKLSNGLDLAAVLARGELLRQIEEEGLWSSHPEGFQSLEEMAKAMGISAGELSQTRDLCWIVFPFIEQRLNMPVAQFWQSIGKSNFRELTPVMKYIITGESPNSAQLRDTVQRVITNAAASWRGEHPGEEPGEGVVEQAAISGLLELGEMPNRAVRNELRPERTPMPPVQVVSSGESQYVLIKVETPDQLTALQRKLSNWLSDAESFALPADHQRRAREAARIRLLRELNELLS